MPVHAISKAAGYLIGGDTHGPAYFMEQGPHQRRTKTMIEHFSKFILVLVGVLALAGCPRESRYVVNNFSENDVFIESTVHPVKVEANASIVMYEYDQPFEIDRNGHRVIRANYGKAKYCSILDFSNLNIDRSMYFADGKYSTKNLALLSDGSVYVVPHGRDARVEFTSGALSRRPRLGSCSAGHMK